VFFTRVTHRGTHAACSRMTIIGSTCPRMRDEPHASPIRRRASLSNIWDNRAEGFATAFEEILMHAGLYDDNPRAKELVWIMLANRAARGLASLYVQANEFDLQQAGKFHADVDAARLGQSQGLPHRLRTAVVFATAGIRHQLHRRQIDGGPVDGPNTPTNKSWPARPLCCGTSSIDSTRRE